MELRKRKSTRLKNFDYSTNGAYFITICTKDKKTILSEIVGTNPENTCVQLSEYGKIADKHIKAMNDFYPDIAVKKYVIMPNHIHLLIEIYTSFEIPATSNSEKQNSTIARFISTFKRFCNKEYGENIWQYRSNDHVIRGEKDYVNISNYIELNPIYWKKDCFYYEDL